MLKDKWKWEVKCQMLVFRPSVWVEWSIQCRLTAREKHTHTLNPAKGHVPLFELRSESFHLYEFSSTHLPWLRMTVQLGQQSWLTKQRLGKRPTPTAWRPLWSLSVKPLQLIWGRHKHLSHPEELSGVNEEVTNLCLPHQRYVTRSPLRRLCSF